MTSCLSGLVRVGGVTCRPVCRGWLGWGVLRDVLSVGVGGCYVPSLVRVGWGVLHAVLSVGVG